MPSQTAHQTSPPPGADTTEKPKTPPHSNPPQVTSTPLSKGTAQNARSRAPTSTTINENVQFIEEDVRDAPVVDFVSMLKALLGLLYLREIEPHLESKNKGALQGEDAAKAFAENHCNVLINKAITFCNDQKHSAELKENLRKTYSTKSEIGHYPNIVAGLNNIICSFENVRIGQLELWETIRRLHRLWQLGIAHGDVSYWNLMIRKNNHGNYAVVNDFDLAAIMTPGQAFPTKQGFERTGTKPFVAIALPEAELEEVIQRRSAHDLESVIWCLAWYILIDVTEWRNGTYCQVGLVKRHWAVNAPTQQLPMRHRKGAEHLWTPLTNAAYKWQQLQDDVRAGFSEYSDKANTELIHRFIPCPKRRDSEEWDWVDSKMKEEDIRKEDKVITGTE